MTVWATFGAAMAEATATLERRDQAELVRALDGVADAAQALSETIRHNGSRGREADL